MSVRSKLKIGIIDSGLDTKNKQLMQFVSKGVFFNSRGNYLYDYNDSLGHGTAIADLIVRNLEPSSVELFIYKIFNKTNVTDIELLKEALTNALTDKVNIINCSLGSIDPDAQYQLGGIIKKIISKGIIIVSAWNDENYTAWPANFDGVISVKGGTQTSQTEWHWEENKKNHVIFRGTKQRVKWKDNLKIFVEGSSLATALCTNVISNEILRNKLTMNIESILQFIKESAIQKKKIDLLPSKLIQWNSFNDKIKRAGIYPFFKEMHGFIRFIDELDYSIEWIADFKLSKNAGKNTNEVLENCDRQLPINTGLPSSAGTIDTLIIGYLDKASEAQNRDLLSEAFEYAFIKKLNVFSFLPPENFNFWLKKFNDEGLWINVPFIQYDTTLKILNEIEEKRAFDTPIIGVFGTSPQQGKFTFQLELRYELQKRGLKVGQIGTEHQSGCFGLDFTFPSGYGADKSLQIPLDFHIPMLRRILSEMDKGQYDMILVGAQSGLLHPDPYYYGTIYSELFLTGTLPDRVILLYNKFDEPILIKRIENLIFAKTEQFVFEKVCFDDLKLDTNKNIINKIINNLTSN